MLDPAFVRDWAVSGYATNPPQLTFSVTPNPGDIVIVYVEGTQASQGLPASSGGAEYRLAWTGQTERHLYIGKNLDTTQPLFVDNTASRQGGVFGRTYGFLVSGVDNPDHPVAHTSANVPYTTPAYAQGPIVQARRRQLVLTHAVNGSSFFARGVLPSPADWIRYNPSTSGASDILSATPTSTAPVDYQAEATSASTPIFFNMFVIGDPMPDAPENLASHAVTVHSAQVSWEAADTGAPPMNYEARINGGAPFAATSPLLLTDLIQDTGYTFEVRAIRDTDFISAWSTIEARSGRSMSVRVNDLAARVAGEVVSVRQEIEQVRSEIPPILLLEPVGGVPEGTPPGTLVFRKLS